MSAVGRVRQGTGDSRGDRGLGASLTGGQPTKRGSGDGMDAGRSEPSLESSHALLGSGRGWSRTSEKVAVCLSTSALGPEHAARVLVLVFSEVDFLLRVSVPATAEKEQAQTGARASKG